MTYFTQREKTDLMSYAKLSSDLPARPPLSVNMLHVQSTLVISNSKGLSEILRDIRTSTYQICRIEEKLIRLTTFNKYMCSLTPEARDTYIENIVEKRRNCSLGAISPLSHNIFYMLLEFNV